jgi:hypothetical protein
LKQFDSRGVCCSFFKNLNGLLRMGQQRPSESKTWTHKERSMNPKINSTSKSRKMNLSNTYPFKQSRQVKEYKSSLFLSEMCFKAKWKKRGFFPPPPPTPSHPPPQIGMCVCLPRDRPDKENWVNIGAYFCFLQNFFAGQSKQRIIFARIDKAYYTLHSLALGISVKKGVQEEKRLKEQYAKILKSIAFWSAGSKVSSVKIVLLVGLLHFLLHFIVISTYILKPKTTML